jgi:hypothetical protein
MRKACLLIALAITLALRAAAAAQAADGSTFLGTSNPNPVDGLVGYHVYGTEVNNRGFSLDYGGTGTPGWSVGLEQTYGDFYLFNYNYVNGANTVASNNTWLRMRGDTGQLALGSSVSHPVNNQVQMQVNAGTSTAPLDGLGLTAYGSHNNLVLGQGTGGSNHTSINLAGLWLLGTDAGNNGGTSLFVWDNIHSTLPLKISNSDDMVTIGNGATINGTTTVNGPASLLGGATINGTATIGSSASQIGFYGGAPQPKFTLSGCRSDGTALANLIQKLQAMGLLTDQTTP